MKKFKHYFIVSLALLALSSILFVVHYIVFGDGYNTAYYSLMNLCFIPINSLVVTIILENFIDYKAKQDRMEKLNILIGIFFTEVGSKLMHLIINADKDAKNSVVCFDNLDSVKKNLISHDYNIDIKDIDVDVIKVLLVENSTLFINLVSNENLHQHEKFTDLLMSVIHLRDEIIFMENDKYHELNINHLEHDILRVYRNITLMWVDYLEYLNKSYPFLYNNAIRVNPFRF